MRKNSVLLMFLLTSAVLPAPGQAETPLARPRLLQIQGPRPMKKLSALTLLIAVAAKAEGPALRTLFETQALQDTMHSKPSLVLLPTQASQENVVTVASTITADRIEALDKQVLLRGLKLRAVFSDVKTGKEVERHDWPVLFALPHKEKLAWTICKKFEAAGPGTAVLSEAGEIPNSTISYILDESGNLSAETGKTLEKKYGVPVVGKMQDIACKIGFI